MTAPGTDVVARAYMLTLPDGKCVYVPTGSKVREMSDEDDLQYMDAAGLLREASDALDGSHWRDARKLINEAAAILGEEDENVVGLRTLLHFAETGEG